MRFTYFWPGWAVALGIAIVIGTTAFVYLRLNRPLQARHRFLLIALRIFAASILLGCLLAPVVIEKKDITPPTHLSILVDTSKSMQLADGESSENAVPRIGQVNQLLFGESSQFLQALRNRFQVHLYPFDTKLRQSVAPAPDVNAPSPEASFQFNIEPEGTLTNIGTALREVADAWKGQQRAGVVLITDGAHNSGQFPLEALVALDTPVYAIGVGNVEPPKDIQIQRVDVTPVAYTGHESVIRVTVVQTGYTGETTRLSLREVNSNRLVDAATLTFTDEQRQNVAPSHLYSPLQSRGNILMQTKQVIELKLTPQTEGNFQYTVALPTLDSELTNENNEKTFSLKSVKAKLNVFYLEGKPRWEYTFLKRALERDPDIEPTWALLSLHETSKRTGTDVVLSRLNGYYPQGSPASETPRFPETLAELLTYDVLILGDVTAEHLTPSQQSAIVDFVEVHGKPIIFLPSGNMLGTNGLRNTELAKLLPIHIPINGCRMWDTEFTVQLTQSGAFHPMLQLGLYSPLQSRGNILNQTQQSNVALWRNLPALSRFFSGFRLRGGARTLMETGKSEPKFTTIENSGKPLLIFQRAGLGKSLLIAAEGLWNWDFGARNFKDTNRYTFYARFWAQVLRWMATNTDGNRLYLTTDASTYAIGDTVAVTARVYSETYQPQAGATIQIQVTPPEGTPFALRTRAEAIDGTADNAGTYNAQFEALQKGTYRIRAIGVGGNTTLEEEKIDIYVQPQLAELEAPQLNENLLKQLAAQTGGAYLAIADAESLPDNIEVVQNPVFAMAERELWAHPLILMTVVGLLGTEWFLRKRMGLT